MPNRKTTTQTNLSTKIKQLEEQTEWFYGAEFNLDDAPAKYQAATQLAKEIELDLNELKNKIEIISEDFTKA